MRSVFYTGASGLMAQQQYMNNVANNIANVNTTGYQTKSVSFEALVSREMYVNTETDPLVGLGTKCVSTGMAVGQGGYKNTLLLSDFAVVGDGFFAIDVGSDVIEYTRDGTFSLSMDGETGYLTTQDGSYVLDTEGNRIEVPRVTNGDGEAMQSFDFGGLSQVIGVYTFDYASALSSVSNNRFVANDKTGEAQVLENSFNSILQGSLENSGVSMEDEMAALITGQRAYQISARVVQVGDENAQTINSLRR